MSAPKLTVQRKRHRWPWITAAMVFALVGIEIFVLTKNWPFAHDRVAESLGRSTGSMVQFGAYRQTFFPHPGCEAEAVTFGRNTNVTLARIRKLRIQGSWTALLTFRRYVPFLYVEGAEVRLPKHIPPPIPRGPGRHPQAMVGTLIADGATLEFSSDTDAPTRFQFPKLALQNVAKSNMIRFDIGAQIPIPAGSVTARGEFGPWNSAKPDQTPLLGSFELMRADLSTVHGIRGTLAARGKFQGPLASVAVEGRTDTPDFVVKRHAIHLRTNFSAALNSTNGDVTLQSVRAEFLRTVLDASGSIAGGDHKLAALDFKSERAHIQDLLRLFTEAENPALNGPVTLQAHAELPPGDEKFLRKLRLDGRFVIDNARFARARSQNKVNELSARSRGEDVGKDEPTPDSVSSDLKGKVAMRQGIAHLEDLSFQVPGATASGSGDYDLISKRIDIHGAVRMQADASEAASGFKGILLKPFDALFRKGRPHGAVMPISITGYYPHPKIAISPMAGKSR